MQSLALGIPGGRGFQTGSSKGSGPDVGEWLACWRNDKDGRTAGRREQMREIAVEYDVREAESHLP